MIRRQKASQIILRGFFIFPFLMLLLSCATVSPIEQAREKPVTFADVESVKPNWQSFADGVDYFHGKTAQPRLEFWALRIELAAPNTRIVVKGGAMENGRTLSVKVSSFVRGNALAAGINATPFDVSSTKEGQPIKNSGLVISGGRVIAPANPRYDALVFLSDGRAVIVNQSATASMTNIENAVGGFHHILKDGEPAQRTIDREGRHPRSAAGVSPNGERLYLLVIDGKRSGSVGGTERETALLLRALGSWQGLNLDGGGSTALAMRYPNGKVQTVNTPVHGIIPGVERAVAGCIGIELIDEDLTQRR
jgi:exopolysaccharide biosynthesis protein